MFTGADECVKCWDIRHSKKCLYELSTGNTTVLDLKWSSTQSILCVLTEKKVPNGTIHVYFSALNLFQSPRVPGPQLPGTELILIRQCGT